MRTAQLLTAALAVIGALLLAGCAEIPHTTEQLQQQQEVNNAAKTDDSSESMPIETPDDYTVEEFISGCIDKADNRLHFWTEDLDDWDENGLHIRARDAQTWIASDGEYYAEFDNQAVPGTHWHCRSDSEWLTQSYRNEPGARIWKSLRGSNYREIKPDLQGDAYYRVSQEPDTSWQDDPEI